MFPPSSALSRREYSGPFWRCPRRQRDKRKARTPTARTPAAAPMPTPAFAPELRPEDDDETVEDVEAVGGDVAFETEFDKVLVTFAI